MGCRAVGLLASHAVGACHPFKHSNTLPRQLASQSCIAGEQAGAAASMPTDNTIWLARCRRLPLSLTQASSTRSPTTYLLSIYLPVSWSCSKALAAPLHMPTAPRPPPPTEAPTDSQHESVRASQSRAEVRPSSRHHYNDHHHPRWSVSPAPTLPVPALPARLERQARVARTRLQQQWSERPRVRGDT